MRKALPFIATGLTIVFLLVALFAPAGEVPLPPTVLFPSNSISVTRLSMNVWGIGGGGSGTAQTFSTQFVTNASIVAFIGPGTNLSLWGANIINNGVVVSNINSGTGATLVFQTSGASSTGGNIDFQVDGTNVWVLSQNGVNPFNFQLFNTQTGHNSIVINQGSDTLTTLGITNKGTITTSNVFGFTNNNSSISGGKFIPDASVPVATYTATTNFTFGPMANVNLSAPAMCVVIVTNASSASSNLQVVVDSSYSTNSSDLYTVTNVTIFRFFPTPSINKTNAYWDPRS